MKRKDLKKKNYLENFSGKVKVRFKGTKYFFYLRKLYLRKHKNILKKHFIMNFIFYNHLYNFGKYQKQKYLYLSIKDKNIFNVFYPNFTFKKQFFGSNFDLKDIELKHNLKSMFFYKSFFNNIGYDYNFFGLNYYVFNVNKDFLKETLETEDKDKLISDKNINFITKYNSNYLLELDFNFFFTIHMNSCVEIRKILILLYLNKLI